MLYSITGIDKENSLQDRLAARPEHIKRLKALQAEGRLILAGPNPTIDSPDPGDAGFSGSLIVAEFDSLQQAEAWAAEDPYKLTGVYTDIIIKPFLKALP